MFFSHEMSLMDVVEFRVLPLVQMKEDRSPIDLEPIRELSLEGLSSLPPEDRLISWAILTGFLPRQAEDWNDYRHSVISEYKNFIREFGVEGYEKKIFPNTTRVIDFGVPNNRIMEIIHSDVVRTGHNIVYLPIVDEQSVR